jgi:tRNA threonylcarbamoyladenosine biosynthesis protein TsaE
MKILNIRFTNKEVSKIAKDVISFIRTNIKTGKATLITLSGDLGAGKTTLIKEIAQIFGVTEVLSSPTFVIMKRYDILDSDYKDFFHLDAYRLSSGKDLENLGFKEILLLKSSIIFLEWPEKVPEVLVDHGPSIHINLKHINEDTRELTANLVVY